ncbi:MAG: metallopeptidase TldD-related protein [Bacteroidota bacterium]
MKLVSLLTFILLYTPSVYSQDELLNILSDELDREWEVLKQAEEPAYYISYRVEDQYTATIGASLGSIVQHNDNKVRLGQVDIRVGDYTKDNTREVNSLYGFNSYGSYGSHNLPIDNEKKAIQQALWKATHDKYNQAVKAFRLVDSQDDDKKEVSDFSKEKSNEYFEDHSLVVPNMDGWDKKLKRLSSLFTENPYILNGNVNISSSANRSYLVDTEGTKVVRNKYRTQLTISADIVTEDDEVIPFHKTYNVKFPEDLPSFESLTDDIEGMMRTLDQLRVAPLAEPFTGPALLHPRAAGVFFHEIFGHRIEGHRLKSDTDGQTFKEKVGTKVLPEFVNIYSDPTRKDYDGKYLNGYYRYDDEGIASRKVEVVKNGILKTFLMSRSPLEKVKNSNGHGRSNIGLKPVARQSNLIIEANETYDHQELRSLLIKECEKQGKEYGYYFVDVEGGFTRTDRYATNAFNILPILVYRIYIDERPDELVRGVDLIGTPLAMFAEIMAMSNETEVFNGICGAESGNVPVSAVSPGLFVRRIETQKKPIEKQKDILPILERPKTSQTN